MALFGFLFKKQIEEVKRYMDEQNYEAAAEVADGIPDHKLKSAYELNLLGKAYKCNGDYLQAKTVFEHSYAIRCSRTVILDIMDCCLEIKDLSTVETYFDEYHKVAPEDKVTQYIYRYKIEKSKGRDRHLLITILEELKALEYMEEFAYELAKQYHKAGMAEECMNECNDIIMWFGFGPTVERAKTLLAYYRGEISLEEIKSAGTRYRAEQARMIAEMAAQPKEETVPKAEAEPETPVKSEPEKEPEETELPEETDRKEEQGLQEEENETETYDEEPAPEMRIEETGIEEPQEEMQITEQEESLPELDFSEVDFDIQEEQEESRRDDTELYIQAADTEDFETQNERLTELFHKSSVSVADTLKNFGRIERIRKQIIKSLELVVNDREKAYFVITGDAQTGKTTLAFHFIKLLYELGIVKYDRTATIDAVQLNQVSIKDYGDQLRNCNLVIENAGGMTKDSINGLIEFSSGRKGSICVILEDSVRNINKFLRAREELNSLFNNRIHLGKYSAEDLLGFAYDYIEKEDYSIDKMAAQILKNRIEEIARTSSNEKSLIRVLELTQSIIDKAEERTGRLILTMANEGRILGGNYLVLTAEDVTP